MTAQGPAAPTGTVAVMTVGDTTVNCTGPQRSTSVTGVKLVPVMVTTGPPRPKVGLEPVIVGGGGDGLVDAVVETADAAWGVPPFLVTWMGPVVAKGGTTALRRVSEPTLKVTAGMPGPVVPLASKPLKTTRVVPVKPVPVMVTVEPSGPLVGARPVMVRGMSVHPGIVAVAEVVVSATVTWQVSGAANPVARIEKEPLAVAVPRRWLLTVSGELATAPEPSMRSAPAKSWTRAMVRATAWGGAVLMKAVLERADTPPPVMTAIGPVLDRPGTKVVIVVSETTVKAPMTLGGVTANPLKSTWTVEVKPVPVIVMGVPAWPLAGVNDVMVSGAGTGGGGGGGGGGGPGGPVGVKTVPLANPPLAAEPKGVVTHTQPAPAAPAGTVAVISVGDNILNGAGTELNPIVTRLALARLVPVMVTVVPTGPLVGAMFVIVGSPGGGVNPPWASAGPADPAKRPTAPRAASAQTPRRPVLPAREARAVPRAIRCPNRRMSPSPCSWPTRGSGRAALANPSRCLFRWISTPLEGCSPSPCRR